MKSTTIVWFRNDLRLHDNEGLEEAYATSDCVVPVYVFDPRIFNAKTSFGFEKTGRYRAQFLLEAVEDLRQRFVDRGGQLLVRVGYPEDILCDLAKTFKATSIYCNRERTAEEVAVQDRLEQNLWSIGQELRYNRGKMLYYTSDLPFPINQTPDTFSAFRKEVEKYVPIRPPRPISPHIGDKTIADIDFGDLPTMVDFGHAEPPTGHPRFKGGETEGLAQLDYYLWQTDLVSQYKDTRNQMLGWDYSSKLSPWLSAGCVSPKQVYAELQRYERERTKNKSTYWLFFELLWRDFFRLMGKKHENCIFKFGGPKAEPPAEAYSTDPALFRIWAEGRTGIPIVDANMRELASTGFMSNRGRQITASFLVNDLKVNWIMGAEYFESLLLDYDPCSNYGNWNYLAGVGSDPREDRYFNPISQSRKYDPHATYIKAQLPELAEMPDTHAYRPWDSQADELETAGIVLGRDYPKPVVDPSIW